MRKHDELISGCMAKARDDEMTFVLLGRDEDAPDTIRDWIRRRIRRGKNQPGDPKIVEAAECARTMESERDKPATERDGRHPSDVELFQKCEACGDKLTVCRTCNSKGYCPIGLNLAQIERAIEEATHFYQADGTAVNVWDWNVVKARRIEAAVELDRLRKKIAKLEDELQGFRDYEDLRDCRQALRDIAKATGCNHTESPEGRAKVVQCVEDAIYGEGGK